MDSETFSPDTVYLWFSRPALFLTLFLSPCLTISIKFEFYFIFSYNLYMEDFSKVPAASLQELKKTYAGKSHDELFSIIENLVNENTRLKDSLSEQDLEKDYPHQLLNPNPIIELNREGVIIYVNSAALETFPALIEEGRNHPLINGISQLADETPEPDESNFVREIQFLEKVYEERIYLSEDRQRLQVFVTDITERKHMENALKAHQDHLETFVDARTVDLEILNSHLREEIEERIKIEIQLKESEKKLRKSYNKVAALKQKAESANQLKSQFLANVSHDIRTPLNAILGFTDLLLKQSADGSQTEHLRRIKMSGEGLLNLINDILDFSKIEAGQLDIYQQSFFVRDIMETARSLFDFQFRKKGIRFNVTSSRQTPEIIHNDKWRINQIITNLLSNALKFTHSGTVTLALNYKRKKGVVVFYRYRHRDRHSTKKP